MSVESSSNSSCHLIKFIIKGDVDRILNCLRLGANVNSRDRHGDSALHLAIYKRNYRIVQILLKNGANPNNVNYEGNSCLHIACMDGALDIVHLLMNHGGDMRKVNCIGVSPMELLTAFENDYQRRVGREIVNGHTMLANFLVANKINEFISTSSSSSPSNGCAVGCCCSIANSKRLFANSANIVQTNNLGSCFSLCPTGFGTFLNAPGDDLQSGLACSLPVISNQNDLKIDSLSSPSFKNGAFSEIVNVLWKDVPVSLRKVTAHQIIDDKYDNPLSFLVLNQSLDELRMLSNLRHPHIILLMGIYWISKGNNFDLQLMFERIYQSSLYHQLHVKAIKIPKLSALNIMRQVTEAIIFLHDRNIFHCGISSHAIFLLANDYAKLGNFEYATSITQKNDSNCVELGESGLPRSGLNSYPCALYNWLSPELLHIGNHLHENYKNEQLDCHNFDELCSTLTSRSDVFGLAVVLWEALTGFLPHASVSWQELQCHWSSAMTTRTECAKPGNVVKLHLIKKENIPCGLREMLKRSQFTKPSKRPDLISFHLALVNSFKEESESFSSGISVSQSKDDLHHEVEQQQQAQRNNNNMNSKVSRRFTFHAVENQNDHHDLPTEGFNLRRRDISPSMRRHISRWEEVANQTTSQRQSNNKETLSKKSTTATSVASTNKDNFCTKNQEYKPSMESRKDVHSSYRTTTTNSYNAYPNNDFRQMKPASHRTSLDKISSGRESRCMWGDQSQSSSADVDSDAVDANPAAVVKVNHLVKQFEDRQKNFVTVNHSTPSRPQSHPTSRYQHDQESSNEFSEDNHFVTAIGDLDISSSQDEKPIAKTRVSNLRRVGFLGRLGAILSSSSSELSPRPIRKPLGKYNCNPRPSSVAAIPRQFGGEEPLDKTASEWTDDPGPDVARWQNWDEENIIVDKKSEEISLNSSSSSVDIDEDSREWGYGCRAYNYSRPQSQPHLRHQVRAAPPVINHPENDFLSSEWTDDVASDVVRWQWKQSRWDSGSGGDVAIADNNKRVIHSKAQVKKWESHRELVLREEEHEEEMGNLSKQWRSVFDLPTTTATTTSASAIQSFEMSVSVYETETTNSGSSGSTPKNESIDFSSSLEI